MAKLSIFVAFLALSIAQVLSNANPCPEHGHVLVPHEQCTQYYQCFEGKANVQMCPPGLHFNPRSSGCDYVIQAACDPRYKLCPDEEAFVRIPYPDNCKKYIDCENGHPNVKDCPAGLHYDQERFTCNYPENVQCKGIVN